MAGCAPRRADPPKKVSSPLARVAPMLHRLPRHIARLRALTLVHPLRKLWTRRLMSGTEYADNHRRLNALYYLTDPWGFTDPREETRFKETNRILLREFGQVGTLLEVGCAEG